MICEIKRIETEILKPLNLSISDFFSDLECEDYFGYNFKIGEFNVKFRKAKITRKKIGQFVTLWKRNKNGKTEAFETRDNIDFIIILTEENRKFGFFLFAKKTLEDHRILSTENTSGKRGFRVYAEWDFPDSKQAEKTKTWQNKYFIHLKDDPAGSIEKFKNILSHSHF